jgi:hypothetical protein
VKNHNNNHNNYNIQSSGYYVGSASNMTRIYVLIMFLFMVLFSGFTFYYGERLGDLQTQIDQLRTTCE